MYQPLSLFIGLRYTRAKRRNQFISFVSLVSLLGMVLGVVALVVVLSVMNGFEAELRNRILAVVPHGFLRGPDNQLADWQQSAALLEVQSNVKGVAPYIDGNVMLSRPGMVRGATLHAVDPAYESNVSSIGSSMMTGALTDLKAGEYNIILGKILARFLGVYVGDDISVVLPRITVTPVGVFPRIKRFRVTGIFQVGASLDSSTVFIHLADGKKLFQYGDKVNGLRLQFDNVLMATEYLPDLLKLMPVGSTATSWAQTQGSLFQAVKMEKTMVSLLLLIIVAIAAFNIVSILTMMVADKRADIAVLRTMGATSQTIMLVFMIQGITVGLLGVLVGIVIAVPVALNVGDIVIWFEAIFGAQIFSPDVYFISRIPSVLEWSDVLMVSVCGFVLSLLATIYPSVRASKVQPAETLRYE
ncbi:MAG: lipoprotein-releasing ABC transporter permease subunit [Pseudomonadales bacterium]